MWLFNRISLICLFLVCAVESNAQFNVAEYLSQSSSALEIQSIRAQMDYLGEGNFKSPFLREVELRIRTRDFLDATPDDYRFRVAPLNPYERRANKNHAALLQEQMTTQQLVEFSKVLSRRYLLVIQYHFLQELQDIEQTESARYKQLIKANSRRVDAGKEIIELDKRLLFNELQREDIVAELKQLDYQIRSAYTFTGQIDLSGFSMVSVEQMAQDLRISTSTELPNIFVQNEQNKLRLSESDLEINRQESFSNIGYLQAEYRTYRGETFAETVGLQLAFQLPIVNPDRPDLERRKLDIIQDQQDVEEVKREVDLKLFTFENNLETMINQYERITDKLESFDSFTDIGFSNVEALIELEDYRNDLTRKQLELYHDILTMYTQWLEYRGMLVQVPYLNYLSASRESLLID